MVRPDPDSHRRAVVATLATLATLLGPVREAAAEPNDGPARDLIGRAFKEDFTLPAGRTRARARFEVAQRVCGTPDTAGTTRTPGCSPPVRAELLVGFGALAAEEGKADEATTHFRQALALHPEVQPPPGRDTSLAVKAFKGTRSGGS